MTRLPDFLLESEPGSFREELQSEPQAKRPRYNATTQDEHVDDDELLDMLWAEADQRSGQPGPSSHLAIEQQQVRPVASTASGIAKVASGTPALTHVPEQYDYDAYQDELLDSLLEDDHTLSKHGSQHPAAPKPAALVHKEGDYMDVEAQSVQDKLPEAVTIGVSKFATEIEGDVFPITGADGTRVYCGVLPTVTDSVANKNHARLRQQGHRLLKVPVHKLMREIEDKQFKATLAKSERLLNKGREQQQAQFQQAMTGEALWVDKYAPKNFMDLLSDEWTNREVAKWVKSWHQEVFGTQEAQMKSKALGGDSSNKPLEPKPGPGKQAPETKTILVSGPPGLGKTTLAHIVAKQCGYHPFEINASDDRSAGALMNKIMDAIQMQAVLGKGTPNCIIVDEIDGATGGQEVNSAVNSLVQLITAADKAGKDKDKDKDKAAGKKKKRAPQMLTRPLICICNDLYVPALRPLREVSRIFYFKAPLVDKLVARLKHICMLEGIKADHQALVSLCEKTGSDMRACLNTLQFLGRQVKVIKAEHVQGLHLGQKDIHRSAMSALEALIFGASKGAAARACQAPGGGPPDTTTGMFRMMEEFGDYELLLSGVHENLLLLSYLDINMAKTSGAVEMIRNVDCMLRSLRTHQEYALMAYVPALLLQAQSLTSQANRQQLQWPRSLGELHRRTAASSDLMDTWVEKLAPAAAQQHDKRSLLLDMAPALQRVTSPAVRAVPSHLLTPHETATFNHTVEVMVRYGLAYDFDEDGAAKGPGGLGMAPKWLAKKPGPGGAPGAGNGAVAAAVGALVGGVGTATPPVLLPPLGHRALPLKPALDTLHVYSGLPQVAANKVVPVPVRQAIMQRINMRHITNTEAEAAQAPAVFGGRSGAVPAGQAPADQAGKGPCRVITPLHLATSAPAKPLNWLDQMRQARPPPRPAVTKEKAKADAAAVKAAAAGGGGQAGPLQQQQGSGGRGGATGVKLEFPVFYKFNEGFTSAVKRSLKMEELL